MDPIITSDAVDGPGQAELRENAALHVSSQLVKLAVDPPRPLVLRRRQAVRDSIQGADRFDKIAPDPQLNSRTTHAQTLATPNTCAAGFGRDACRAHPFLLPRTLGNPNDRERSAADQCIECHAVPVPLSPRALDRFDAVSWQQIADRVAEWTAPHSPVMADVVASIRASAADQMAGFMSMHDLAVTTTPLPTAGPIDVIWVRPQPAGDPGAQDVLIEHWSATGWDERMVRPAPEALSLFWRFAREKWGITPFADISEVGPL